MGTICFYQDSRHEAPLQWIRSVLGVGYLTKRNDGMSELRINGFARIRTILKDLFPFIRFKKSQAKMIILAMDLLVDTRSNTLSEKNRRQLVEYMIGVQNENYVTKRKRTREELLKILGLTP